MFFNSGNRSDSMFYNIGDKLKKIAKIYYWVGIISSAFSGIILMSDSLLGPLGLAFLIIGIILSIAISYAIYGFAQLIENSNKLIELQSNKNEITYCATPHITERKQLKKCITCGTIQPLSNSECENCGARAWQIVK